MRRALGRLADEPTYLQHALGPGVAARERRSVRHGPAVDRFVEVLGREIEVAGAKLLNHPLDLVHARPPARCPPAPAVHDPLCPVRLIGIAQPAKVPLAHPQQLRRLYAAQLLRLMRPNRIDDPGHSDLRQHAIPPVKTGQIVCYKTRTYLVSPTQHIYALTTVYFPTTQYQEVPYTQSLGLESDFLPEAPYTERYMAATPLTQL